MEEKELPVITENEIEEQKKKSENVNKYTNYLNVSGWYLALAHLKNHDGDKAKNVLSELRRATESAIVSQKADELMEKIK